MLSRGETQDLIFRAAREAVADPGRLLAIFDIFGGPQSSQADDDGIAIVRVVGSLYRGFYWDDYREIAAQVDAAIEDPMVRGIVLDIDSPGGRLAGLFDLATHLYSLRGNGKPIWAIANDQACSAAYAIASACERVFASRAAIVGSIGVLCVHVDYSKNYEQAGIKVTEIASGSRKTDTSSSKPLSARGRDTFARIVAAGAEQFHEAVALHRGLTVEEVAAQEAGVYVGAEGIEAGLIDAVGSLDDLLGELREQLDSAGGRTARPFPQGVRLELERTARTQNAADAAGGPEMRQNTDPGAAAGSDPSATPGAAGAGQQNAQQLVDQAVANALAADRTRQSAINELCTLVGRPELAGGFISAGSTEAQVRASLLEQRAAADQRVGAVHGGIDPNPGKGRRQIDTQAVYQRFNNPAELYTAPIVPRG